MPIFRIHHITKYEYERPVKESMNEIKIFPFSGGEQEILLHDLQITDNPDVHYFNDYWGNKTGVFSVLPPHKLLTIESKLLVRTTASSQLKINFHSGLDQLKQEVIKDFHLVELSRADHIASQQKIHDVINKIGYTNRSVASFTEACCEYIFKNYKYIKGITNVETTVEEILEIGSGVCQDFAHLMLQILRTLHIPARYVSGYICPNKNGMRGEGATHAWVEVWVPQYGWAGIDPTNNVWVTNTHVKLAVGRNFHDCSPVKGTFKGPSKQKLSVYVSVAYEDGNVFEEMNNVNMEDQPADAKEELIDTGSFAQQQ